MHFAYVICTLPSACHMPTTHLSCTQGGTEAQEPAARPARSRLQARCTAQGAIRSGTRYAKWAGGSRSQTHRRAAMCGFIQDDGNVQGVAPMHDAPRNPSRNPPSATFPLPVDASQRHTGIGTLLGEARTILLFHIISARPSKQPRMLSTFLKVYLELGSYFLFLQEQIKDIIIIPVLC